MLRPEREPTLDTKLEGVDGGGFAERGADLRQRPVHRPIPGFAGYRSRSGARKLDVALRARPVRHLAISM
jgi:hypothetical protein